MKHLIFPIIALMSAILFATGDGIAAEFADRYDSLEKCEWKSPNGTLLYRKLTPPDLKPGEKYPLLIFLHGAGERGNNNISQVAGQDSFLNLVWSEEGSKHPCYVIVPQCPSFKKWCEVDWNLKDTHATPKQPSDAMGLLYELLQDLKAKDQIDPKRIYVTGISMGGYGTFDFIVRYPEEVAAAIPVCGGGDNEKLATTPGVKDIPIQIFHGDADGAVPVQRSRNAYAALKKNGCDVKYTEYPGVGHDCWFQAYKTPGLADWMFSQKKK